MGFTKAQGGDLYYEEKGHGVPILLISPAGATASTWGAVAEELARAGRVVAYDRRVTAGLQGSLCTRSPSTRRMPRRCWTHCTSTRR
jgi:pimeloyl-ACP methyl ester carboxylesterase